jgi:hypothetical protein
MKHTPAPWHLSDARSTKVNLIDNSKKQAIGEIVWVDTRNPADAKLIAAAPDLLEACIEALNLFDNYPDCYEAIGTLELLQSAIAKATRKQQ